MARKKFNLLPIAVLSALIGIGYLNAQSLCQEEATVTEINIAEAKEDTVLPTAEIDRAELKSLYHDMWKYMLEKNVRKLDAMHADEFVLVHMTGMRQSKEEYLRCIRDGELDYFTEKTEQITIDVKEGKGTMVGQSQVEAAVFGGSRNTWTLQLAFYVEKRNGKWVLLGAKASIY